MDAAPIFLLFQCSPARAVSVFNSVSALGLREVREDLWWPQIPIFSLSLNLAQQSTRTGSEK